MVYRYNYVANKEFNLDKLTKEIQSENIDLTYLSCDEVYLGVYVNEILESRLVLDSIIENHISTEPHLRIYDLVDESFSSYLPNKIDFRKMLKINIHIQKDVIMHENGRPDYAIYTYNNENIAKIRFEFELNDLQLMTRRKEILTYFDENNIESEEYIISDEIYNLNSEYHQTKVIIESTLCRENVLSNVKITLNSFLRNYFYQQNPDPNYVLSQMMIVADLFTVYSGSFESWLSTGLPTIINDLNSDTNYAFLDIELQPNFTIRQYAIMRFSAQ